MCSELELEGGSGGREMCMKIRKWKERERGERRGRTRNAFCGGVCSFFSCVCAGGRVGKRERKREVSVFFVVG